MLKLFSNDTVADLRLTETESVCVSECVCVCVRERERESWSRVRAVQEVPPERKLSEK